MTDNRKLFADTVVTTTHLLKKCIKVPKVNILSAEEPNGYTKVEAEHIMKR